MFVAVQYTSGCPAIHSKLESHDDFHGAPTEEYVVDCDVQRSRPAEDNLSLGPAHEVHLRSERAAVGLELKFKGAVVQQCVQLVTVDALAEHVKDAVHRLLGVNMRTDAKVVRGPLIGEG